MNPRKKFAFSIAAFLVLALLSWNTMSSVPIPIHSTEIGINFSIDFRLITLVILGLLATRTALAFWRTTADQRRDVTAREK